MIVMFRLLELSTTGGGAVLFGPSSKAAAAHRAFVAKRSAQSLLAEVAMGIVVDMDVSACGCVPHKEMVRQGTFLFMTEQSFM